MTECNPEIVLAPVLHMGALQIWCTAGLAMLFACFACYRIGWERGERHHLIDYSRKQSSILRIAHMAMGKAEEPTRPDRKASIRFRPRFGDAEATEAA